MVEMSDGVSEMVELLGKVFIEPGELVVVVLWIMIGGVLVSEGFMILSSILFFSDKERGS